MRIIVLNDGETFTGADGCVLLDIRDNATDNEIKRAAFKAHAHPTMRADRVLSDEEDYNVDFTVIARF